MLLSRITWPAAAVAAFCRALWSPPPTSFATIAGAIAGANQDDDTKFSVTRRDRGREITWTFRHDVLDFVTAELDGDDDGLVIFVANLCEPDALEKVAAFAANPRQPRILHGPWVDARTGKIMPRSAVTEHDAKRKDGYETP